MPNLTRSKRWRSACWPQREASSPRCSTTAPMASLARSRIYGVTCSAISSRRASSAGTTSRAASSRPCGQQGEGRIVFCSSVLGLVSAPYRGAYCASKFAVEALADALRMELAATGIRIVLIEPGPIASRFLEHALDAYRRNIDLEGSAHRETYRTRIARLEEGGDQTFKLGPEGVALKLVPALESRNPKRRYYVTFPTYAAALLRRVLPPPP